MKKIFYLMLTAVAAVALTVSCKPGTDNGGTTTKSFRLVKYVDAYAGTFDYKYDANGILSSVVRVEEYDGKTYNSTYTFNKKDDGTLEILENDKVKWTAKLNANGLITEWNGYKTLTYDGSKLVKVEEDGAVISEATWENGNITKWTRKDGETFKEKLHKYGTDVNKGNIRNIFVEDCGVPRWLAETGLIGDGTANLCTGNGWGDASASRYEYEGDANGLVTKETKIGGSGEDEYKEEGLYTWEEVK